VRLLACTFDYFLMMCATLNMSTVGNGTVDASCTGPASGYKLKPSRLFVVFVLFLYRLNTITNNIYAAIILLILNNSIIFLLDFEIKIYCKMPKHLTGCPITVDANPRSVSTTSHASATPLKLDTQDMDSVGLRDGP
jgi:hypothetical protein